MADLPFPQPVLDVLRTEPDRPAIEHGDRVVTAGELLALTGRIADGLRAAGLGPDRGVAMLTQVTPEAYAAHLAAHVLGCRVTGVRPGYSSEQLAHLLADGVDAVAVTGTPDLPAGHPPVLSIVDLANGPGGGSGDDLVPLGRPDDIARLVYTSGSTGLPKGCAWSYGAMSRHWSWAPARWDPATVELSPYGARYLLFGTLASAVVMDYAALALLSGGTLVIPPAVPAFPEAFARYRLTGAIVHVPRLYQILDALGTSEVDTSTLRGLLVSGSPLPAHRLAEAIGRLGPVMFTAYGQSEAGNLTIMTPSDIEEFGPDVLASVGKPHRDVSLEIRDGGEVWARNPHLMTEYWRNPAETAEILVDGWLRTRDLGRLDANGFLYLSGRAREVIIVDAFPYYAGPIEQALATHPAVDQAYVVGAPDERTGEAVHAFVVPAGQPPAPDVLRALVRARLGPGSVPKTITFLTEVPVADSGKPDKKALAAELAERGARP